MQSVSVKVQSYGTRSVPVPATGGNPATTKIVANFQATGNGVSLNMNNLDPTAYPESTYGTGQTVSVSLP